MARRSPRVRKVQLDYNELSAEEQRIKAYPTAAEIKALAADQEAANDSVEIRFVDAEYGDAAYASRRLAPGTLERKSIRQDRPESY